MSTDIPHPRKNPEVLTKLYILTSASIADLVNSGREGDKSAGTLQICRTCRGQGKVGPVDKRIWCPACGGLRHLGEVGGQYSTRVPNTHSKGQDPAELLVGMPDHQFTAAMVYACNDVEQQMRLVRLVRRRIIRPRAREWNLDKPTTERQIRVVWSSGLR